MDLEKAVRIAANRNRRRKDAMPLFPAFVDQTTAQEVQQAFERHAENFARVCARLQHRGDDFRNRIRDLVSPEEFATLERRRAILPASPEYHADFWQREWQARIEKNGGSPTGPAVAPGQR